MKMIVVSDLDGTLLDHHSYSFEAARPALDLLCTRGIPLILASSKTAAEMAALHAAMGLGETPGIVENGAGIFTPGVETSEDTGGYTALRAALETLAPDLRSDFRGFGDMTDSEVAEITGLAPADAARARRRQFSEPGLFDGDEAAFVAALAERGITARRGGRFLTLSRGGTKADMMRKLAADLGASRILALGDAPNDIEMLEAADFGVIVRNDHGPGIPPLEGERQNRIWRTEAEGPEGWNAAVLELVNALGDQGV